jgi:hypothetical protein
MVFAAPVAYLYYVATPSLSMVGLTILAVLLAARAIYTTKLHSRWHGGIYFLMAGTASYFAAPWLIYMLAPVVFVWFVSYWLFRMNSGPRWALISASLLIVVGYAIWQPAVNSVFAMSLNPVFQALDSPGARTPAPSAPAVPRGDADTRYLQESLTALGIDPGPIDGKFGARTRSALCRVLGDLGFIAPGASCTTTDVSAALVRFQKARGLVVNGYWDQATVNTLSGLYRQTRRNGR